MPRLRNVDKRLCAIFVKAYGHNGYFKSLKLIVHLYDTRDVLRHQWPWRGLRVLASARVQR